MPDEARPPPTSSETRYRRARFVFRAPSTPAILGFLFGVTLVCGLLVDWPPTPGAFGTVWGLVFAVPAFGGALLTGPVAAGSGGRFEFRRSVLLAVTIQLILLPIVAAWRLVLALDGSALPAMPAPLLFLVGPALWFRQMTLYGVSRPNHAATMAPALTSPLLLVLGVAVLYHLTVALLLATLLFGLIGFLCAALLLRAADRPLRREFGVSGASLIRPMLDHVNDRDPEATERLETFFRRFAILAHLRVVILSFVAGGRTKATIVLPTVHPGPFAALGASDLPRKVRESLGSSAGTVFVPHTPCDHDLDLPDSESVGRILSATRDLNTRLAPVPFDRASPLVEPSPGSFARAQLLGRVALVTVSQAPEPSDDIAYAIADRLHAEYSDPNGLMLALIDAHNSYVGGQGDLVYGTPQSEKLQSDVRAAVGMATRVAGPTNVSAGVAANVGYQIRTDGIGPDGIRALVLRVGSSLTAYVLIDGNNLVHGMRAPILKALEADGFTAAEVMTTDNHVVHEVDGTVNPIGERVPLASLVQEIRKVVRSARENLEEVELRAGAVTVSSVPVLGPSWTPRLLTSLGDTVSVFGQSLLMTFLLLLASSTVVLIALR